MHPIVDTISQNRTDNFPPVAYMSHVWAVVNRARAQVKIHCWANYQTENKNTLFATSLGQRFLGVPGCSLTLFAFDSHLYDGLQVDNQCEMRKVTGSVLAGGVEFRCAVREWIFHSQIIYGSLCYLKINGGYYYSLRSCQFTQMLCSFCK